jgi:hypothetical protein
MEPTAPQTLSRQEFVAPKTRLMPGEVSLEKLVIDAEMWDLSTRRDLGRGPSEREMSARAPFPTPSPTFCRCSRRA